MTAREVKALPIEKKIELMAVLWEDMRSRFEGVEVDDNTKALLDERRARVERGESKLHDWDEVKFTIGEL